MLLYHFHPLLLRLVSEAYLFKNKEKELKMRKALKIVIAIVLVAFLFTACNTEDNPIAPDPGNGGADPDPIVIKTPRYMRIESIKVTGFPKNKSNGDTWDWNPFSSTERKPDIEVTLDRDGNYFPAFWSDRRKNANYTSTYVFTKAASSEDGKLPHDIAYSHSYKVYLVDDDIGSKDDMGYVSVKPSSIYKKDNATNFDKLLSRNGVKIKVKGAWIY
jgi:hypothetical protein